MESTRNSADDIMRRLLFVKPRSTEPTSGSSAERAFGFSLLFSGVRCILQYAIFPFLLPVLGIAANVAIPFLLLISFVAMGSLFFSLRRFWQIDYEYKWQYLIVAVASFVILIAFAVFDVSQLLA